MKFRTDSYFRIGKMHENSGKPCQDYALTGIRDKSIRENIAYGIVSDGCSSGGNTDLGSRFISKAVEKLIYTNSEFKTSQEEENWGNIWLANNLKVSLTHFLSVDLEDILATCCYITMTSNESCVTIFGDGACVFIFDNCIKMTLVTWKNNTPWYPAYMLIGINKFLDMYKDNENANIVSETWECARDGSNMRNTCESKYSTMEGIFGIRFHEKEPLGVVLFTDGITQILGVDWKQAVLELIKYKSMEGEFVKRRMICGLSNYIKEGHYPLDDIACAALFEKEKS